MPSPTSTSAAVETKRPTLGATSAPDGWMRAVMSSWSAKANLLADLALLVALLLRPMYRAMGVQVVVPMVILGLLTWIIGSTALRHYEADAYTRSAFDDAAMIAVLALAETTGLMLANLLFFHSAHLVNTGLMILLALIGGAFALRLGFRRLSRTEAPQHDVLIVGAEVRGRLAAETILRLGRQRVIGFVPLPGEKALPALKHPVLGQAEDLEWVLRNTPVSEVYIAGNALRDGTGMQSVIRTCERLGIPFALPLYSFRLDRARPHGGEGGDGYVHYSMSDPKLSQRALKRLFDVACTALALWLLLPLFLGIALIIKLTSRGPVFFKQKRVGLYGRHFNMLKFRSMVVNAEELKAALAAQNEQSGPVFKMKNDPRVTPIGRFIRKFSIDELPQLINVLRGDMSIVGPRPPVPPEVARYEAWQRRRLSVRPGLTCIWQVSGRNQISFEEWMYLDMQYIDHWSLGQDISLILQTVPVVLTGRGAS